MAKRPDLLQAMREKSQGHPQTVPPPAETSSNNDTPPSRAGKRQVAAYFPAAVQKQLRLLTVEEDTTVQGLLAEALNDLFAKYGKPEIAPTGDRA